MPYSKTMSPDEWVRKNKKRIAREILSKFNDAVSESPAGIFTAGLPGAGKTEFTTELVDALKTRPIRIDMDELAKSIEGYSPEIADSFRQSASSLLQEIYTKTIRSKTDFVFDGTLSHPRAIENIERALKRNYTVKVYYVHQRPEIARQFTIDRELVEKRGIDRLKFIETYQKLYENLLLIESSGLPISLSVVIKDDKNREKKLYENVSSIIDIIGPPLERDGLERVIIE